MRLATIRVAPFVLLASVVLACSGSGSSSNGAATAPPSKGASAAADSIDRQFIDMMVPHHQSAVEMAKLAKERATNPELKTLADQIIAAQNEEITKLRSWRRDWFGSGETPGMGEMPLMNGMSMLAASADPSGMPGMSMAPGSTAVPGGHQTMDMTADIDRLKTADPFDKAFIDAMTQHHQLAIAAAKIVLASGEHAELKALAQEIVTAQQREIDQMAAWRQAWYPNG